MVERTAMSIVLEADVSQVSHARRFVRRSADVDDPALTDDLQLIASELFTNAVEHGSGDAVEIIVAVVDHGVCLTVVSRGPTPGVPSASDWQVAVPDAPNGRGLGIVREIADELVVERDDDRFVVTATLSEREPT